MQATLPIKINFSSDEEKADIIRVQTTNGFRLVEEANLMDENYLIFEDNSETLDNIKQQKFTEIDLACKNAITGGFNSTAYQNTNKIYDSTLEDQANITGNALSSVSKVANVPGCENDKFYYHARGEEFVEWQPEECLQLARDFKTFKEQQLIKNKQLQAYIQTFTTVEEVQSVTWDTVIPT